MKSALIHVLFLLFEIDFFPCPGLWTLTRTRTSLDSVLTRTRPVLVLDSTKVVLTTALHASVFGDADKVVEPVSFIEGDSVTLHTGVTEIQRYDVIEWRLNGSRIAKISGNNASTDGVFRDGMKLDRQTGDLKITNIKTTDSGEYKLEITTSTVSSEKTFSVSGVSGVDEVKSVSVIVGYSVTLNSGTIIQRDDVMQWRFADHDSPIAEHNRKTGIFSTSDVPDGIFRHRLQLDYSTGSLTIRNIGTKHSGLYEAGIRKSSSGYTIHRPYSVTLSGEIKSALSVKKRDSVTLDTGLTKIQTDDFMQWMFEDSVIAEINKAQKLFSTYDGLDGRFRDRLKLDKKTGSLTITDTRTEDSGLYEVKIISIRFTINKRITVIVSDLSRGEIAGIVVGVLLACAVVAVAVAGVIYYRRKISKLEARFYKWRILSVKEGEDIILNPDDTKVHKDDKLVWMFRSARIAEKKSTVDSFTVFNEYFPDREFRDRLKLNDQTGSLTITNTRTTDSGDYELQIIRWRNISMKRFRVSVFAKTSDIKPVSVKKGGSVTLPSGVTDTKTVDEIVWSFGLYNVLAEIKGETENITSLADGIFKGRLELDHQKRSLTINKIRPEDAGIYMIKITRGGNFTTDLFKVSFSVDNPEDVPLTTVYG